MDAGAATVGLWLWRDDKASHQLASNAEKRREAWEGWWGLYPMAAHTGCVTLAVL